MQILTFCLLKFLVLYLVVCGHFVASSSDIHGKKPSECPADAKMEWSYRGDNGPSHWGQINSYCDGQQQSPVNINNRKVIKDKTLQKLYFKNYDIPTPFSFENDGHTIQLVEMDGTDRSIDINGLTYYLEYISFHWGKKSDKGTEHKIDGRKYALEMHLVHIETDDPIAVVAILFKESRKVNKELQKIIDQLAKLKYKGLEVRPDTNITLNNLLPENPLSHYRYMGSLTSPTCEEAAWIVSTKIINISRSQIAQFRKLYSAEKEDALPACTLSNNIRPIQPLNGRPIYLSV